MNRLAGAAAVGLGAALWCCVEAPPPPLAPGGPPPRSAAAATASPDAAPAAADRPGGAIEVFVTGSDDGYLDACGCDDGLLGGLPRRRTLLFSLGAGGDDAVILSNGGLVTGTTPIDRMKVDVMVQAMHFMRYSVLAVTDHELALGRAALEAIALNLGDDGVLLGTNLVDRGADDAGLPLPTRPLAVRSVRGERVAIVSAVATSRAERYRRADSNVELADPARAVQAALDQAPGVENVIVLAQMSDAEATRLAQALPVIDWIVIPGDVQEDFPREEPLAVGETLIVTTGRKGKFLGSLRFPAAGELAEYGRHPIVDTLDKDPSVVDMLRMNYREWLPAEQPIREYFEQKPPPNGAAYAGAEEGSCASCHPKAWEIWAASKHARAWQTLVDQDLPPDPAYKKGRQAHAIWDPDCVRCHVTGFGYVGGYAGPEREAERASARLIDVGCEACHGPAGDHAERAAAGDPRWPSGPVAKVATGAAEALCMECHDPDNSPHFELKAYWEGRIKDEQRPTIAHGREGD
ncbi:MAG: hypothetical protein FJ293_12355 [Planctomycetes bacterium]|nr:hypothetical protein [Planctomycetota bacterium]